MVMLFLSLLALADAASVVVSAPWNYLVFYTSCFCCCVYAVFSNVFSPILVHFWQENKDSTLPIPVPIKNGDCSYFCNPVCDFKTTSFKDCKCCFLFFENCDHNRCHNYNPIDKPIEFSKVSFSQFLKVLDIGYLV